MRCLILLFFIISISAKSQIEIDASAVDSTRSTDRYTDYSDQLLLKVMSVVKSNDLEIKNTNNEQSIMLKPYGISSLGFGFNYKWLGLAIAFGLPATDEEIAMYGKTTRFDFQLNIYSRKFVIDVFAQQYNGYYVENAPEITSWNETFFPLRESMQTLSLGVGGYYVFNHKKMSYKAAYVRNAVQKKSAGSFLLGGFYNIDYGGFKPGDTSSFVPSFFPQEVQDSLPIDAYLARSVGISFGYTYTFVFFKRFFINLSLIPGAGSKSLRVHKNGEEFVERSAMGRFNGRVALGYENKHFLMGLTTNTITGTFEFQDYEIKPSTSNVKFFFAKRFNLKKDKK